MMQQVQPKSAATRADATTVRSSSWPTRRVRTMLSTSLECGGPEGPEGDLMEFNGWSSPQMLRRYGASARSARARRTYDRIMDDSP
jgi:hypothetical protein